MGEYFVMFYTKISAKSENQLEKKAEKVGESLSKCLKKTVTPHGYVEIKKKDSPTVQTTLNES